VTRLGVRGALSRDARYLRASGRISLYGARFRAKLAAKRRKDVFSVLTYRDNGVDSFCPSWKEYADGVVVGACHNKTR